MTSLFVLENRKVVFNGKTSVFTFGDVVTEAKIRRLHHGRLPSWVIQATDLEALIIRNNHSVDQANDEFDFDSMSESDKVKTKVAEEHLLSLGFTRNTFGFGTDSSRAYSNSDKETVWVGVKMESESDAFIGHNNKRVSLSLCNYISVNTLISRVENGKPLFLGNQA